jgi:hypothetical protein
MELIGSQAAQHDDIPATRPRRTGQPIVTWTGHVNATHAPRISSRQLAPWPAGAHAGTQNRQDVDRPPWDGRAAARGSGHLHRSQPGGPHLLDGWEQAGHQVHLLGRLMKQHLEP